MVPQVDTQLERNPQLPAPTLHKLRNSPLLLEESLLHCRVSKDSPRFPWNLKGSLTHFTVNESRVPCLHTGRDLTPCLKWHTKPETHIRTGEEP